VARAMLLEAANANAAATVHRRNSDFSDEMDIFGLL